MLQLPIQLAAGIIHMNGPPAEFLDHFSPVDQGFVMIMAGGILGVAGLSLLWVGKRMIRGLGFLFALLLDWTRRGAMALGRTLRQQPQPYSPTELRFVR